MASQTARKRKSTEMDNGPSTPTGSPAVKKMKITAAQKQALIDNLQLEITERARQLRAHYALQCQDLKARIERRINRVPVAMRKTKMGDLMAQHEKPQSPSLAASPAKPVQAQGPSSIRKQPPKSRKRKSSAIHIPSDKENHEPDTSIEPDTSLTIQKNAKRAKTAATTYHNAATTAPPPPPPPPPPKPTTSKTLKKPTTRSKEPGNPMAVLSPRSHNSRTFPPSPIKDAPQPQSPTKAAQPPSPLKHTMTRPASPFKSAATAATSALSSLAKRGAAAAANLRPSSRDKDAAAPSGFASPTGKMLPPPRPALATVTSSHALPNLSPQRTASQTSIRSVASDQSTTSNGTVVTKSTRTTTKTTLTKRAPATKTATTAVAKKTTAAARSKIVLSETTVTPLSPKTGNTGVKRAATTAAAKATAVVKRAGTLKKAAAETPAAATTTTGRVLRKRN